MTTLSTSLLNKSVLSALTSAGWTGLSTERGYSECDLLRLAGVPVGVRGRQFLSEVGGIVIAVTTSLDVRPARHSAARPGVWKFLLRLFSNQVRMDLADVLPRELTVRVSFIAADILECFGWDHDTFLDDVAFTLGRVMSVVATDWNDRYLLMDEESSVSYVLDRQAEKLVVFPLLEDALNAFALTDDRSTECQQFERAPDDFKLDSISSSGFFDSRPGDFRFRIHRCAARFPDQCSVEIFILSDGTVKGTARDTARKTAFVPVHLKIDQSQFAELQAAFVKTIPSVSVRAPSVNIGYGECGKSLEIKHLSRPIGDEDRLLWERTIAICDWCLQVAFPDRNFK